MDAHGVTLGIDLGTSAVKVLALTGGGEVLARAEASYGMDRPRPGWVLQDPHQWWNGVQRAVDELELGPKHVTGIGLSGQLNGLVPVDGDGSPISDAMIWLDQRAGQEAEDLSREHGEAIRAYGFCDPSAHHNLSKLLWLKRNRPEALNRAHKILFPKDYITHRLTGEFVTDVTDAGSALMVDLRSGEWVDAPLDRLISRSQLPRLHESPDRVGSLRSDLARRWDLSGETPVAAGAGDMSALALGTGVIRPNTACATIGTAGHVAAYLPELPPCPDDRLWILPHAIPGRYFWHGLVMTGGFCLQWYLRRFGEAERMRAREGGESPYDLLLEGVESVPPGSRGIVFLPYLDGVATPHRDPGARGAFVGFTSDHDRVEFTRAVLEGVAYNFRDAYEALDELKDTAVSEVMVGEGGSRHPIWPRILADVLGRDAAVLSERDASALGAAMLGGVAAGVWEDCRTAAADAVVRAKTLSRRPDVTRQYEPYYRRYCELYPALEGAFHRITNRERTSEDG